MGQGGRRAPEGLCMDGGALGELAVPGGAGEVGAGLRRRQEATGLGRWGAEGARGGPGRLWLTLGLVVSALRAGPMW